VLCHALLNQSTTLGGDMAIYQYGPAAGTPWSAFNLEQQGKIVEQWFAWAGRQSMTPQQLAAHGLETAAMVENEAINPYSGTSGTTSVSASPDGGGDVMPPVSIREMAAAIARSEQKVDDLAAAIRSLASMTARLQDGRTLAHAVGVILQEVQK
jgi:hypothetical protein